MSATSDRAARARVVSGAAERYACRDRGDQLRWIMDRTFWRVTTTVRCGCSMFQTGKNHEAYRRAPAVRITDLAVFPDDGKRVCLQSLDGSCCCGDLSQERSSRRF